MHQGPSVTTYSCGMALRSCAASAEAEALGPRPPVGSRSRRVVPCLPRPRGRRCFRCELHAHRAPSRAAPRAQYGQAGPAGHAVCAQPLGFKQPSFSPLQPPASRHGVARGNMRRALPAGTTRFVAAAVCWHHVLCRRRAAGVGGRSAGAARARRVTPRAPKARVLARPDTGTACFRRVSRRPVARGERTRTLPQ